MEKRGGEGFKEKDKVKNLKFSPLFLAFFPFYGFSHA